MTEEVGLLGRGKIEWSFGMMYIVDRFEGKYGVLEDVDGVMTNVPISDLPAGVREGDVLVRDGQEYMVDAGKTEARKKKMKEMMGELWDD